MLLKISPVNYRDLRVYSLNRNGGAFLVLYKTSGHIWHFSKLSGHIWVYPAGDVSGGEKSRSYRTRMKKGKGPSKKWRRKSNFTRTQSRPLWGDLARCKWQSPKSPNPFNTRTCSAKAQKPQSTSWLRKPEPTKSASKRLRRFSRTMSSTSQTAVLWRNRCRNTSTRSSKTTRTRACGLAR